MRTAGLLLLALALPLASAQESFIVAKINGKVITSDDVLAPHVRDRLASVATRERKIEVWTQAVRERLDMELALQAASRLGIKADKRRVDGRLDQWVKTAGGEERARQVATELGLTLSQIREKIERSETIRKVLDQMLGLGASGPRSAKPDYDIYIRPSELSHYYESNPEQFQQTAAVKVRMITVHWGKDDAEGRARARRDAESIIRQVEKGAEFAALASFSSSRQLRSWGGRWPMRMDRNQVLSWVFVERDELPEGLRAAVFSMSPGQLSPPLLDGDGYSVVQLVDRRRARKLPFSEVQQDIKRRLEFQRRELARERIFKQLRREATIHPPNLFTEPDRRIIR